ncbi:MAG: response regulator, partial [Gemmatimonadota bacterium]|nr:response regulator [Gemmatimonadota bacterium]
MEEKILLVDDDPNILSAYKRNLRKQFHIEVAGGGEEGLEALKNKGPFAVIVADMQMPGMDGIQ